MLPKIKLQGDVDVVALSPLVRGMLLSVAYADGEGGIGLTATGAINRKFVHWAMKSANGRRTSFSSPASFRRRILQRRRMKSSTRWPISRSTWRRRSRR